MQTWYEAVCDKHKTRCTIFRIMSDDKSNMLSLPYKPAKASEFLLVHNDCSLYLAWRDDQKSKCENENIMRENYLTKID